VPPGACSRSRNPPKLRLPQFLIDPCHLGPPSSPLFFPAVSFCSQVLCPKLSYLRHQHALPQHNYRTVWGSPSPGFGTSLWANKYAILSHRWFADEDEVSYDNMLSIDSSDKPGYAKILGFCKVASAANRRFDLVGTCCINKANSSEFSEAIYSIYLWYSCSKICIAYLPEVPERRLELKWSIYTLFICASL